MLYYNYYKGVFVMKYDDLEKTQDLFDIKDGVPTPIENIEEEGINKDNLTDELTFGLVSEDKSDAVKAAKDLSKEKDTSAELNSKPPKNSSKKNKPQSSLKEKWQNLSKKKKIILCLSLILILILIFVLIFFLLKNPDSLDSHKKPNKPVVIVEEENYRYEDGTLTFLDVNENALGTYECTNKEEELCYVAKYSDEDNFDTLKNVYESGEVIPRTSKIYQDNYVFINDSTDKETSHIVLYNIKEAKVEGTYALVKGFKDSDYVILKDTSNKYGSLSFTEEGITPKLEFSFNYLGMLNKDSNVVVKINNDYFIYNQNGEAKSKGLAYEIKSYTNDYIIVHDDNSYYLFDYRGNQIFTDEIDYLTLYDKYVLLVKDNLLYIKDTNNNKYLEDGIELSSSDYNPVNVYDSNNTFIEKRESFSASLKDNILTITYKTRNNTKDKIININEGLASSKIANLNYFDGKLYIYADEVKSELLGSYACQNKNILNSPDDTFKNCTIAKESFYSTNEVEASQIENLGMLPVFNNRYIFVQDSLDTSNPTITLYDLQDKKTLSKYSSVDAGLYSNEPKLTFIETTEAYVMASNKSNKYGVIKIGEDKISSAISFDYVKIEKIKDYFMAIGNADNYMLIDTTGKILTDKLGRKIVDYAGEYLKTVDSSGRYYVSDFQGESYDSTGYLDITLGDTYYVVITSNYKLDIYKYDSSSFSLSRQIDIGSNYKDNYTVTKSSDGYTIKINSTGETFKVDEYGFVS